MTTMTMTTTTMRCDVQLPPQRVSILGADLSLSSCDFCIAAMIHVMCHHS
jgi:hypothetical protein